jgi:uncharacterized protein
MVKKRKKKTKKNEFLKTFYSVLFILVLLAIGAGLGYYGGMYHKFQLDGEIEETNFDDEFIPGEHVSIVKVPAVGSSGEGVTTDLLVKIEGGNGRTLVDINTLLFWVDTQNSIRKAKMVAENITGYNLEEYDITYAINANASLIGGESAGSALTVATIAALKNKKLREDVLITGTINHDGSLGPIGGILEKAKAAKNSGANLFLVPLLQAQEIVYEESEHCEKFGFMEWCSVERIPKKIDISSEVGIEVVEVGSISEALDYFYAE